METSKIKNLFKIKSTPSVPKIEKDFSDKTPNEETRRRTYHEAGFRDGTRNSGSSKTLKISLEAIYAKFQNEEKENDDKQRKLKEPYEKEQREKNTEIRGLNVSLENKNEQIQLENSKIDEIKTTIENVNFEINDLAENPDKYGIDAKKGASAKFWIGLLLLIPITLYLFTFYISTSYSAFFKNFDPESEIIESILDARALTKSWEHGIQEGAFVTFIPFVFLGLGYLIHMFGEKKSITNSFKVVLLFVITFIFDAILAYQIEDEIYKLNKTFESPEFSIPIAFTKVQFWGIIFAGFVVYIIGGLVFDFVMKEHKEKDKVRQAQQKRLNDIKVYNKRIDEHKSKIDSIRDEIANIKELTEVAKNRIQELQGLIDGVIIPSKEYKLYATEYMQGWLTFIHERMRVSREEQEKLVEECSEVYNAHMNEVGANSGSQNTVYVSAV